jgi:regulatory protein
VSDEQTPWEDESPPKRRAKKKPRHKKVTPHAIERWAIHHLDRYSSSAMNLRQVLRRRIMRIEIAQEESFPDAPEWIDATIKEMRAQGFIDDRKYAVALVERLRGRGSSTRKIQSQLSGKGVPWEIVRECTIDAAKGGDELKAALKYARRRRLGPYRLDPETRAEQKQRDLGALGRSGFSYGIASQIIDAEDVETLESAVSIAE